MKNDNNSNKKKAAAIIVFVTLVFLYLSLWINSLVTGYSLSGSPVVVIKSVFEKGFPTEIFLFFLFVEAIFIAFFYFRYLKDKEGMDVRGRAFRMSQGRQSYGESHFETPKEYEDLAIVQDNAHAYGTIIGQLDHTGKHLINIRMDEANRANRNIAIVGASGTGKTYTFSKNFCYQAVRRRESVIVTDPDGGLYADMAGYFMDNGYIVRRLDLNKLHRSDGWDCLKSVMGDDTELNAQLFAQIVISNVSGGDKGGIYTDGPMSLLKALVLRVVLGSDYPPEEKNIRSVYQLLQNPRGEEFLDELFDVRALPTGAEPSLGPYLTFKQGSPNLRGNLITNLTTQLQLFQSQTVCKVLSTDDIDLVLPAQQPCAYFCIFPDSHDTYKFIVSLFFSMLFIKLIGYADDQPERRCPIPVNFLLDEFPSIGRLPDFDKKMATIRKRAISVAMIFQDITQLQHNYEDTWVTLLSNCATFISLGINDEFTSSMVTKRIGDTTIEARTERHMDIMSELFKVYHPNSTGEGKRALMSYDELFKLNKDESIILFQGHNPILAIKYPHVLHPEYQKAKTHVINPTDIVDIDDEQARKKLREEEKERVEAYLKAHPLEEVDRSYADCCEPEPTPSRFESIKNSISESLKNLMDKLNGDERDYCDSPSIDYEVEEEETEVVEEENFSIAEEQSFEPMVEKNEPYESAEPDIVPNNLTPPPVTVITPPEKQEKEETPPSEDSEQETAPEPVKTNNSEEEVSPWDTTYEGDASTVHGQDEEDMSESDIPGAPGDFLNNDGTDSSSDSIPNPDSGEGRPEDEKNESVRNLEECIGNEMNLTGKKFTDDAPLVVKIKKKKEQQLTRAPAPTTMQVSRPPAKKKA